MRGIAGVNFVSDSRSGRATVTAISGQAGAATNPTVEIAIGNALPARVIVTADPQRITSPRNARIVATVFDEFGNPVQNVPVSFSIDGSLVEETLDSGGALVYTNSNGQVERHAAHAGPDRPRPEDGHGDRHHGQRHHRHRHGVRRLRRA